MPKYFKEISHESKYGINFTENMAKLKLADLVEGPIWTHRLGISYYVNFLAGAF